MFSVMLRIFKEEPFKRKTIPTKPLIEAFAGNIQLKN